jgi:hypothetical protein
MAPNYELGIRYREILARAGVKVQLLATTGSLDNLAGCATPDRG